MGRSARRHLVNFNLGEATTGPRAQVGASRGIVVTERVPLKATDSSEEQPGWNLTVASSFAPSSEPQSWATQTSIVRPGVTRPAS